MFSVLFFNQCNSSIIRYVANVTLNNLKNNFPFMVDPKNISPIAYIIFTNPILSPAHDKIMIINFKIIKFFFLILIISLISLDYLLY